MTSPSFPLRRIDCVWHTGTLNPADKRPGSYEGSGLSVSRHPDAWERLARGRLQGHRHRLTCPEGRFLDARAMRANHRAMIQEWAIANKYVSIARLYRFTVYNEDLEERMTASFTNRREAVREADGEAPVRAVTGLVSRVKLSRRTLSEKTTVSVAQDLAPLFAEDVLDLDGVWWAHRLDVLALTAPCGVIAAAKLDRWTIESDKRECRQAA